MPISGVIPLPPEIISNLGGTGAGRVKSPSRVEERPPLSVAVIV